jgi:predicted GNAT superfamily acetyltransferase
MSRASAAGGSGGSSPRASTTLPRIEVRLIGEPAECERCVSVYREVFGLAPGDGSLNARLLTALTRNSGMVVGAYVAEQQLELVGFALSFLARQDSDGRLYQYSQTAAVLPAWQGLGVGRAMKFAQRSAALSAGIDMLRWTFDPLRPANGHFNLDVLGAVVTGLSRDLYGAMAAPDDRGEPTDRFAVDWELTRPAVAARAASHAGQGPAPAARRQPAGISLRPGELRTAAGSSFLAVPADWHSFRRASPYTAARLRDRILGQADGLLAAGLVAVSCTRLDSDTAAYQFAVPD